jgi:hypothetical protein
MSSKYPQHDKLRPVREQSQTVGEFVTWLADTKGWFLATFDEKQDNCRNCQHPDRHNISRGGRAWGRCTYEDDEGEECACTSADFGNPDRMYPPPYSLEKLLAEFFGIDYDELQLEKDGMLAEIRENTRRREEGLSVG